MPDIKRVSPEEARDLMSHGYIYVDVRSIPEFEEAHPTGSINIPFANMTGGGMSPNPDFVDEFEKRFPKDSKIVLGCRSGGRSLRAAEILMQRGFTNIIDQRAGFEGTRDAFGRFQEKGWQPAGLPISSGQP